MNRKLKRTLRIFWNEWRGPLFALAVVCLFALIALAACDMSRCPADRPNLTVNETILTQAQAGEAGGMSVTRRMSVTSCER